MSLHQLQCTSRTHEHHREAIRFEDGFFAIVYQLHGVLIATIIECGLTFHFEMKLTSHAFDLTNDGVMSVSHRLILPVLGDGHVVYHLAHAMSTVESSLEHVGVWQIELFYVEVLLPVFLGLEREVTSLLQVQYSGEDRGAVEARVTVMIDGSVYAHQCAREAVADKAMVTDLQLSIVRTTLWLR